MNARQSEVTLLESLGRELARTPTVEGIALEVHRALRPLSRSTELRIVVAERSSRWREWISRDEAVSVHSHKQSPSPPPRGTAVLFDPGSPEQGFVWMQGSSPRGTQVLRVITPHIGTAVALLTGVSDAHRAVLRDRQLSRERFLSRDDERRRIAQELHDDLGQSLASLKINLKWVEERVRSNSGLDEAVAELAAARDAAGVLLVKVRDLSHTLYPSLLDTLGLTAALKELVHQATRLTPIAAQCEVLGEEQPLARELAEGLYRCCQEAISNVVRHSGASRAVVELAHSPTSVRLTIEDNGSGFEPGSLRDRSGNLMSPGFWTIRQRVAGMGGVFRVNTAVGKGVTIEITIPIPSRTSNARTKNKTAAR
jgi:signal transduction histidine kinase